MAFEELMERPVIGIRPFNELPIDAEIWREAHEHHHHHRQLHALGAHRPGIVRGLEVVAMGGTRIVVAPGVGIDSEGQTVILSEPVHFTLSERGQTYLTLAFLHTADRASAVDVGGGVQYFRVVEGRDLVETQDLPQRPHLELARIYRSNANHDVRDAKSPFDPENDELNLLHRRLAFPHCFGDVSIGEMPYVPRDDPKAWKPNRAGLWHLARAANSQGFHVDFTGPINLRAAGQSATQTHAPTLLYVAGSGAFTPLAEAERDGLADYLANGGTLLAEASGGSKEFSDGWHELVGHLGAKLKTIKAGHALLHSHHLFDAPPAGSRENGELSGDDAMGIIWSGYDYGAAWQGQLTRNETVTHSARETIRGATEFGVNILAWAATRKRKRELLRSLESA